MFNRRDFLFSSLALASTGALQIRASSAQTLGAITLDPFDDLFSALQDNEELRSSDLLDSEGKIERKLNRAAAPRRPISKRAISERAINLITLFEVTNEKTYVSKYQSPIVPGGESGVTIGVGYDIGYVNIDWLRLDWNEHLSVGEIKKLETACGLKGQKARNMARDLQDVKVTWQTAYRQFTERVLPMYIAETLSQLPNCQKLSDDSLGALVSLVFNRGASFRKDGNRYKEMRQIREHMDYEEYEKIPQELRSMKRIWEGKNSLAGLITRRELEAKLFERGLAKTG